MESEDVGICVFGQFAGVLGAERLQAHVVAFEHDWLDPRRFFHWHDSSLARKPTGIGSDSRRRFPSARSTEFEPELPLEISPEDKPEQNPRNPFISIDSS